MSPQREVERIARAAYGSLVARIAARTRDIAAAEDALADAFAAALAQWPTNGVPTNPEAWLVTTAKRRLLDGHRRAAVRERDTLVVTTLAEELAAAGGPERGALPDDRLRLMFVCTHPAIDAAAQVPLMLQTVLGLDAETIGSALRVAPKTMGQRLWRAKAKIRDAGVPFDVPDRQEWPARLDAVLEAIYAAFGTAWDDALGLDAARRGLADEAIFLGELLASIVPDEPEVLGLLALMLLAEGRRAARRSASGEYVPLAAQDQTQWSSAQLIRGDECLRRAARLGQIGPFQLEAAIQSAHVAAARTGRPDREALVALYTGLIQLAPSLGARVAQAAVLIEARGGQAALDALDAIEPDLARDYQPFWAVRADALRVCERNAEAAAAYTRAIGLSGDEATRRFLLARRELVSSGQ